MDNHQEITQGGVDSSQKQDWLKIYGQWPPDHNKIIHLFILQGNMKVQMQMPQSDDTYGQI